MLGSRVVIWFIASVLLITGAMQRSLSLSHSVHSERVFEANTSLSISYVSVFVRSLSSGFLIESQKEFQNLSSMRLTDILPLSFVVKIL